MRETNFTRNNQTLVDQFKANDSHTLKKVYQTNYPKIEALVLKNSGSKEEAKDVFQEAFVVVWQNIKLDRFTPKNESSVDAYLYTIAKNKWMDVLRSKDFKSTTVMSQLEHLNLKSEEIVELGDDILNNKRLQDVMLAFKDLGDACKNLLMKFYFEKKSMQFISEELELDVASTRNKKYRCMQKLRELALKIDTPQ